MKKFEIPAIQLETFAVEDMITDSSGGTDKENQLPTIPGGFDNGVAAITPTT